MEDTSTRSFEATYSQASSESLSTSIKPHEDQTSTTTESTSSPKNPTSMLTKASELSRLEQLPPELRRCILATLDLNQLKALIKSSPTFYQQYRYDRRFILRSALHTTLGPVAVDAYAVYLSSTTKFDFNHPEVTVPKFLKEYERLLSSPDSSSWEKNLTESEMSELAMFHLSFIQPFTEEYKDWAMTNMANVFEKRMKRAAHTAPLSSTEKLRIMRALYRFQLWCNLLGSRGHIGVDLLDMFFYLYELWEVEEISSVYRFVRSGFWTDLPYDILDVPRARFFAMDGFYAESNHLGASIEEKCLKVKCTIHGVNILPSTSTQINTLYTNLFNTLEQTWGGSDPLFMALSEGRQLLRRMQNPSVRDQPERHQGPIPFKGDDLTLPPMGWTLIWIEMRSNHFDAYMPHSHAKWGFVMWDKARIDDLR